MNILAEGSREREVSADDDVQMEGGSPSGEVTQQDDSQEPQASDYSRWETTEEPPSEPPSADKLQEAHEAEIDVEVDLEERAVLWTTEDDFFEDELVVTATSLHPHRTHGYPVKKEPFVPEEMMEKFGETHQVRK